MSEKCEFCEEMQRQFNAPPKEKQLTTAGKLAIGGSVIATVAVIGVTVPFVLPALRKTCIPYVPATNKQLANVMKLVNGNGCSLVDLGSGDGRIVIEAAKLGLKADGIELNPSLVWYSRFQAVKAGVFSNTKFYRKDLFKADFQKYDNIVIFGVDSLMEQLEEKLSQSARPDSNIIACRFPFPRWTPVHSVGQGIDTVWLYKPFQTNETSNKTVK